MCEVLSFGALEAFAWEQPRQAARRGSLRDVTEPLRTVRRGSLSDMEHIVTARRNSLRDIERTGLYPLTGMESSKPKKEVRPQLNAARPKSPEGEASGNQSAEEEEYPQETRLVTNIIVNVKVLEEGVKELSFTLRLGSMTRHLNCKVKEGEKGQELAQELVFYGLISEVDRDKLALVMDENLNKDPW